MPKIRIAASVQISEMISIYLSLRCFIIGSTAKLTRITAVIMNGMGLRITKKVNAMEATAIVSIANGSIYLIS